MTTIRPFLILLLAALWLRPAFAQEERALPYATTIAPTGDESLDESLAQASRLDRLSRDAPVDAFGLVARTRAEVPRLEQVLRSEGYWAGRIETRINGEAAEAVGLADRLASQPGPVPVEIVVVPGPRYTLRRIGLRADQDADSGPVEALGAPRGLAPGAPAQAGPVLDAEAGLVDRLREAGHPLAAVVDRDVLVDHEAQAMDVTWILAPGPRAAFAMPVIEGDTRVNRALLERLGARLAGEPYSPRRLDQARREFQRLSAFDSVRVRAARRLDEAGNLPVTFAVTDRARNAAGFNLAFETNYGPTGRVYYERRNLFGNAEVLRLEAEVARVGASTRQDDANFRVSANLRRPGLFDGLTTLVADATLLRERQDAYDRDALVISTLFEHPVGTHWVVLGGPVFERGRIGRERDLEPYTLAGFVTGLRYDSTDSVLDARSGIRASMNVTPYADINTGGGFVRALGTARTYFDLRGEGQTVLALRGTVGSVMGADSGVPLDKRFYSGGGGSVRGYAYQRLGPRDARNRPLGGLSLAEGSVEVRQRVRGPIAVAAFVDGGSVGQTQTPSLSDLRLGVGLGMRYATGIGPLRVDVAVPLDKQAGDSAYAFYVGLGQAF